MSLLDGKFSYSKCQSSYPHIYKHWGGPCSLLDQKGVVTHVLKDCLEGTCLGHLDSIHAHLCPLCLWAPDSEV